MNKKFGFAMQQGIGLLELMLSLAIIAILLVMATRYFLVTSYSQKLNQVTQEMAQLKGAVYSWKGGNADYGDATDISDKLIAQGLVASGDIKEDNGVKTIVTPWNTEIKVMAGKHSAVDGSCSGGQNKGYASIEFTTSDDKADELKACSALAKSLSNTTTGEQAFCDVNSKKLCYSFQ